MQILTRQAVKSCEGFPNVDISYRNVYRAFIRGTQFEETARIFPTSRSLTSRFRLNKPLLARGKKTMAEFQISNSVKIDRPAETVFQYITDVPNHTEWRPGLEAVRDYSGPPFVVGTTFSEVSKFMGREMVVDLEVVTIEEGLRADLRMEGNGVSGNLVWAVSPDTEDSSTFTLSFGGEVSGWLGRLGTGLIRRQAEKDMATDLDSLKARLESA